MTVMNEGICNVLADIANNDIDELLSEALEVLQPKENLNLVEWSDKKRRLSPEISAEAGPWRTERTPYMYEPMLAFTDPKVRNIIVVAGSQVGKTELLLNALGYIIDQEPGSVIYAVPTKDDARTFSEERVSLMVRDCESVSKKLKHKGGRKDTILYKKFVGGQLKLVGTEVPQALAGTPARYILGDERDRWATSTGKEGDPWELLKARQTTYYNAKSLEVSTPTIKGSSAIENSFYKGTQERWCHECPECHEYTNITFDTIRFNYECTTINNQKIYTVTRIGFVCPHCGCFHSEQTMKRQPAKWIAKNPDAYKRGIRSFWLNAFCSPWATWTDIVIAFLEAKDDPAKLQVVFNTKLGELWEDRGDVVGEDDMLDRCERYEADLPDGVLALTCGVDTQDDRLEYEVVGYGFFKETWGIRKGYIIGSPDDPKVWAQLDEVIDKKYTYRDGKGLNVGITFVDSGGHYTQEVYEECRKRTFKNVFAIKGRGGEGVPYVSKPTKVGIRGTKKKTWLYTIGVDAGKTVIMSNLMVESPGASYCHFPANDGLNYDTYYFNCLLSEKKVLKRTSLGNKWIWELIPGHKRNEALDCRNYANAAFSVWSPDLEKIFNKLKGLEAPKKQEVQKRKPVKRDVSDIVEDW